MYKLIANGDANFTKGRQPPDISTLNDPFLVQSDRTQDVPFVIITDDAFPLSIFCMKPYAQSSLSDSKRIFGYRLSRRWQTLANVFGILSNRLRVLSSRMYLQPNNATK